ncbi:MAG: GlsB/YeaQ/YmgE family stress response membrane protein [Lachnospiraceae bacterium]|nr:GlsB/YeaQ/YmgE family stress response membrane protein [Lachnospiraceae bacterium]
MVQFIVTLITGGIAGWLAGMIMNSKGGIIRNIIIGLIGGVIGGFLGGLIGVTATSWIASILIAVVGSCVLIWLARKLF